MGMFQLLVLTYTNIITFLFRDHRGKEVLINVPNATAVCMYMLYNEHSELPATASVYVQFTHQRPYTVFFYTLSTQNLIVQTNFVA